MVGGGGDEVGVLMTIGMRWKRCVVSHWDPFLSSI